MTQNMKLITFPVIKYHGKSCGSRPYIGCNSPHFIRDCENLVCIKCKPNSDNHAQARCPNSKPPAKQQQLTDQFDISPHKNWSNGHNDPALQLSVSTAQPDYISELLEAARKMTRYFKKSYKSGGSYQNNGDNNHSHKSEGNPNNPDKQVYSTHINANQVNDITD